MAVDYSKKVLDHFYNPRNMGEIKNPDGQAQVGNPVCGDIMKMFIKVGQRETKNGETEEFIEEVKFKTLGCASAIATSSIVTEMAKGKSLDGALKITNDQVAESLEGLPREKLHCSVLAEEALRMAIANYQKQK